MLPTTFLYGFDSRGWLRIRTRISESLSNVDESFKPLGNSDLTTILGVVTDPASYRPETETIPQSPGVYRFRGENGVVLYVGKANSLRNRLTSYFADVLSLHPRTAAMVTSATSVDWVTVESELEALQLEYTWIKEYRPKFNVLFKDDKSYPYLVITTTHSFPAAYVTRAKKVKGNTYFGPYVHTWALRESIDQLLRVFPIRTCTNGVFDRHKRIGRPCLLGDIGKCCAPCVDRVSAVEYEALVANLTSFMSGRSDDFIKATQASMMEASEAQDYELAASLRDDLMALKTVQEKSAMVLPDQTDADVIAVEADDLQAAFQVFHVRGGRVTGQRSIMVEKPIDDSVGELVAQFVIRLYGLDDSKSQSQVSSIETALTIPLEILVSELPSDLDAIHTWVREKANKGVSFRVPQRGSKRLLMETVHSNARQALSLHKLKRGSDLTTRTLALDELQGTLGLARSPLRIECIDISNHQGKDVVGSLVVFEDGLPKKSDYRSYNLDDYTDDVSAIAQVVRRRFTSRAPKSKTGAIVSKDDAQDEASQVIEVDEAERLRYTTTLLVVDGGAPQVQAAARVIEELQIDDLEVCGLAKRLEEVWQPGSGHPVIFSRRSEALYLLQRLRDESHRFAINSHRKEKAKSVTRSALDDIDGLGMTRRSALLKHFGSMKTLKKASVAEVQEVSGIGPKLAELIVESISDKK